MPGVHELESRPVDLVREPASEPGRKASIVSAPHDERRRRHTSGLCDDAARVVRGAEGRERAAARRWAVERVVVTVDLFEERRAGSGKDGVPEQSAKRAA